MSEDRYRQLQDAITKARYSMTAGGEPGPDWIGEVRHLGTLQQVLDYANDLARTDYRGNEPKEFYYARDLRALVETALRNMGALT